MATGGPWYHQFLASAEFGGANRTALQLADFLHRRGERVSVWVPGEGPAWEAARRLGLPARLWDAASVCGRSRVRAALGNWRAASDLRRQGPGLVHVHYPGYYGALRLGLRRAGLPAVVHAQSQPADMDLAWALRRPPALIVTCSRGLIGEVCRFLPERHRETQKIVAIPNAVDTALFTPDDKGAAKARVGAPPGVPLLLTLANLAPTKGQQTAVRVTAELKRRGVDVACWLAGAERGGATEFTRRLEALIGELGVADRVRLLGPRGDAPELLRAADLFLLPSTSTEGIPLSVLEAQATKTPVLTSPAGNVPEAVTDGATGFLLPADDAAGFAECARRLLDDRELYRRVAGAAYENVMREFTLTTFCGRMTRAYEEVLEGKRV